MAARTCAPSQMEGSRAWGWRQDTLRGVPWDLSFPSHGCLQRREAKSKMF